jgi:uncharacterized protein (DUF1697 family)
MQKSDRTTPQAPARRRRNESASIVPSRYIALLRGINVGGNNIIKMSDLRASFEALGFTEVESYIQSGNVVFCAKPANKAKLEKSIEKELCDRFGCASSVVLVGADELKAAVDQAPAGYGKQPNRYRYDVVFVREPLTTAEVLPQVSAKPGVDTVHAGEHAIYFRRLTSKAAQSHLSKLVQRPVYKFVTIRNWNTATRLLEMASA